MGCTCAIVDATAFGDVGRHHLRVPDPGCPAHGLVWTEPGTKEGRNDEPGPPGAAMEDFEMGCCEAPDPALLEKNNRMFCRNCRRYLDQPVRKEEDADGDARDGGPGEGSAGRGDRPGDGA